MLQVSESLFDGKNDKLLHNVPFFEFSHSDQSQSHHMSMKLENLAFYC